MSKHRLTSIRSIEREWKRLIDWPIDQSNLLVYATSCARQFLTPDQFRSVIVLLDIDQYEAELPSDFSLVCQAAYTMWPEKKHYIKQVSQWTQKSFEDCKLTMDLTCPNCTDEDVYLEIPVDEMYRQANPQVLSYMNHYHNHGGITDYGTRCFYHPEFYLMRPKSGWFANLDYHIKDCINKNIQCPVSYEIVDGKKIVVNFRKGRVLLSYLAWPVDEDGLLLIPDVDVVWEAMIYYIAERESFAQYMIDPVSPKERRWANMVSKRAEFIGRARMRLRIPDPDQYDMMVTNHWQKVVPYYNYWENSNLFQTDAHRLPKF